jgi:V8-like Glu-specific endopeptidase
MPHPFFLFAAAALGAAQPNTPGTAAPSGYFINAGLVREIFCTDGKDLYSGTAWFAKDKTLVTAAHVVEHMKKCVIDRKPVTIEKLDHDADYAIIHADIKTDEVLSYTCEPFKKDETYLAVGYALGETLAVQKLRGSSIKDDQEQDFKDESFLVGNSFEGMSGGPIFNMNGQVVGIVNGGDTEGRANALSRPLTDTVLCGKI